MSSLARLAAGAALLAAVACAFPIRTQYDSAPGVDFSGYRSYAWIRERPIAPSGGAPHGGYLSPIDQQRITSAVDEALAAKGYTRRDSVEDADLVVAYRVAREQKIQVSQTPGRSYSYYPGYGYGAWYGGSSTYVRRYDEGTLTLEFYDRASREGLWVGAASKRLSKSDDPEELIQKAVGKILEPFPERGPG